jgi:hypothetical protein
LIFKKSYEEMEIINPYSDAGEKQTNAPVSEVIYIL